MKFLLPEDEFDVCEKLHEYEPQAPKHIKVVMLKAAQELTDLRLLLKDAVAALTEASSLRIGQMDSHSKADEISRRVRQTLIDVAERLKAAA